MCLVSACLGSRCVFCERVAQLLVRVVRAHGLAPSACLVSAYVGSRCVFDELMVWQFLSTNAYFLDSLPRLMFVKYRPFGNLNQLLSSG